MIDYEVQDGIATLTWNADGPVNVMNRASLKRFEDLITRVLEDSSVRGAILTSAKRDFLAGADLTMVTELRETTESREALFTEFHSANQLFRRMETGGKPFVAALNGSAVGGGYEIALACHYRIAADRPKLRIGLPESQLGMMPAGGGTQRLPRLIGIQPAIQLMMEGKLLNAADALEGGLIDAVVPPEDLLDAARGWIDDVGESVQPWDRKGYRIPGGAVQSPSGFRTFLGGNALIRGRTRGNYPHAPALMHAVYNGLQTTIDAGLRIENRAHLGVVLSDVAQNMVRTLFFSLNDANKLARRPTDLPPTKYEKIGILGAGMMGGGIAYAAAKAGIEVVILDRDDTAAEGGRAYSQRILDKQVQRGKKSDAQRAEHLARIHPTTDYADLAGCQLVIEAVFEDRAVKADVTRQAEQIVGQDAVIASNTSTLPITGLAEAVDERGRFIGMHFVSPVERMPLVEVIKGKETSPETVAQALDFVKAIGKTPIVLNDSRGFFGTRIFAAFVAEGVTMLTEGVKPALIENCARNVGLAVGPLQVADEVSLSLMHMVNEQTAADLGEQHVVTESHEAIRKMVMDLGRLGKKAGKGFYEYNGNKRLWSGLGELWPVADDQPTPADVEDRLLFSMVLESVRCFEEGVVEVVPEADIGSIFAGGFPAYTGGALSFVDTMGPEAFVERCDRLAERFGHRFAATEKLRARAAEDELYYDQEGNV